MEMRLGKLEWRADAIESRLGRIETRLDKVEDRLLKVDTSIATLTERVAHLPSKEFIVRSTMGGLAFLTALALFADKLKSILGIS